MRRRSGKSDVTKSRLLSLNFSGFLQDQNVFDSKKKVKLMSADGVEYKLARKQLQAIEFNKALLAMYTNQVPDTGPDQDSVHVIKSAAICSICVLI